MSMTRDEAIDELLCMAEELTERRKSMLTAQKIEWEAEDLAEIKAALAEPVHLPPCPRQFCSIDHCEEYAVFCGDHGPRMRCQHQAADASLDCTEPAVLCETHGGHDACAVEVMQLQARIAEPVDVTTFVNEGRRLERGEIARALEAHAAQWSSTGATAFDRLAEKIRDGSISEWLPKENSDAK